jgi:hypothetical protein
MSMEARRTKIDRSIFGVRESLRAPFAVLAQRLSVLLSLLYLAGVPGSVLRAVIWERSPAPLPDEIRQRDASLDVQVKSPAGARVENAHVQALAVVGTRVYLSAAGLTDTDGHVHLPGLPHEAHWILADAPGCARAATMLALEAGNRTLDMTFEPEHFLDVEVVDEGGQPIAAAEIEVVARDPLPIGARTDERGAVKVGRLTKGPFVASARAPGLEEVTQRGILEGSKARFVLRKMAVVLAHVTEGGADVPGARVEIGGASLWPARSALTDDKGNVRIASLPGGSYALRATAGERVSPTEFDVALKGGDERNVELKLEPGVMVPVSVIEGDDPAMRDAAPVAGARVTLAEGGLSSFPVEGVADNGGNVRLGPVMRGPMTVSARADGFVARGGIPVPEPFGSRVIVPLPRAGTLVGRVLDGRGFPVDGASVVLVGTDFHGAPIDDDPRRSQFREAHFTANLGGPRPLIPAGELGVMPGKVPPIPHAFESMSAPAAGPANPLQEPWVTRADGTFRAFPATPGRIRALVRHPEFVEAMSDVVTLTSGGEARVEVVMHRGGSLEGRVLDGSRRAVSGARLTVSAMRGSLERTTRTGSDGTFAFASLPDAVTAVVTLDDDPPGTVRARLVITIPEGERRTIDITLPDARPPLPVRVNDDRGYPLAAVQLSASSLDPSAPLRTTAYTDGRGEAKIDGGRGIALRVELHLPGYAPQAVTIDAGAGEPVTMALVRAESASGEVRSSRGDRLRDAEVSLYTEMGARHARTAEDGTFTVSELSPGPARIRVHAAGFASLERTVTIARAGGSRPAQIPLLSLKAEALVEGTVVDGRGDPVQGARVARDSVPTYLVTGATPRGIAVTDARGRFRLNELDEGTATFEALAPDLGSGRAEGIKLVSGRTTEGVRITIRRAQDSASRATELATSGGVAVTLAIDSSDDVILAYVTEGSAAERAGLIPGDAITEIDGTPVKTIAEARAKLSGPVSLDVVVKITRADRTLTLRVPREPVRH